MTTVTPPFIDPSATPLPGLPLTDVCPRAGVFNPLAYNAVRADQSLVDIGISPGDDIYILSTVDIESGDLVAIKTPDFAQVQVRFAHWFAESTGALMVRLTSANLEVPDREYAYDDMQVRTRWRVVWICKHGDHGGCASYKRAGRMMC